MYTMYAWMFFKKSKRLHSRIQDCLSRECFQMILKGFNTKNLSACFSSSNYFRNLMSGQHVLRFRTYPIRLLHFSIEILLWQKIYEALNANKGRLRKHRMTVSWKLVEVFCNIVRSFIMVKCAGWFCHIDSLHIKRRWNWKRWTLLKYKNLRTFTTIIVRITCPHFAPFVCDMKFCYF